MDDFKLDVAANPRWAVRSRKIDTAVFVGRHGQVIEPGAVAVAVSGVELPGDFPIMLEDGEYWDTMHNSLLCDPLLADIATSDGRKVTTVNLRSMFDEIPTDSLRELEFNTPRYDATLAGMVVALFNQKNPAILDMIRHITPTGGSCQVDILEDDFNEYQWQRVAEAPAFR
jgi:hypothetical protein